MSKLEDLRPNASVKGILPDCLVTVVNTQWYGTEPSEFTCKERSSLVAKQYLHRRTIYAFKGLRRDACGDTSFAKIAVA